MKKINLIIAIFCIGIISICGINSQEYFVSNINYTDGNSNLIGKEVNVKGIDNVKFNIIGVDGKKVRLLSQELSDSRYFYNSSADGRIPVAFENSAAYSVLMNNYSIYKDKIAAVGGDVSIFNLDLPTVEEMISVGKLQEGEYDRYLSTDETPNWLFDIYFNGHNGENFYHYFMTRSITSDGKSIYAFLIGFSSYYNTFEKEITRYYAYTDEGRVDKYGASIRPVLETSAANLISSDADVMAYANSFALNGSALNKDNNSSSDKAQIVKVPSTGINAPIIFIVVGLAVIVIAGIIIWTLVKGKKK